MPTATTTAAMPAVISEATKIPVPWVGVYAHQSDSNTPLPVLPMMIMIGWITSTTRILA